MREAIEAHDFGRLFFLVRKWAGISYNRIAEACDIKSSRVSELARGDGSITSLAKIEQIADALRIPGHMLRLARRPWEASTAREPRPVLSEKSRQLPVLNGSRGEAYAEAIRETSRRLVALDNELSGLPIAAMAARAFRSVHRRLGEGDYEPRYEPDVRAAAAELAEVAGWALFDAEKHGAARRFNQEALFLARLSGDQAIELLILQNMGMLSGWLGRPREEVAIARSVLEREGLSSRVEAIFRTREARGLFAAGRESEGARSFGRARSLIQDGERDGDPFWTWWITTEEVDGHQACELQKAGHWRAAIPLLQGNISRSEHRRVGYQSIYSARLLASFLEGRAWREAEEVAQSTAHAVAEISSVRTLNLLRDTVRHGENLPGIPASLRDALHCIGEAIDQDPYVL